MTLARYSFAVPLIMACSAFAQTEAPAATKADQDAQRQRALVVKDAVQGGWTAGDQAPDLYYAPVMDPAAYRGSLEQLNEFRSERNNSLSLNQGVIPPTDEARLRQIAGSMSAAAPMSFEAHLANFYLAFPKPEAFMELDRATAKDRRRDELIAPQLVNSARKDDATELTRWASAMKTRGDVAPGLYNMAEDIMASVDEDGVLIAAGEMDAYPLWTEQFADAKRKDILVVDERLLGDPAYRARIWDRTKARGAVPATGVGFALELEGATKRPVFLSLALGQDAVGAIRDKLYVTGLAMRLSTTPVDNIPALAERWKHMHKDMDTGPLAKNYLVPGAVLLKHYRAVGNETEAARLEHELRGLAQRTGSTERLIKSGVFLH